MGTEYTFATDDSDLIDVLVRATEGERGELVQLLRTKNSCSVSEDCRSPREIAHELQLMGGNSPVNVMRGHGVKYAEILGNVAGRVGADTTGCADAPAQEWTILKHLVVLGEKKMDDAQRAEFHAEIGKLSGCTVQGSAADCLQELDSRGVFAAVTMATSSYSPGKSVGKTVKDIAQGAVVAALGGLIGLSILGLLKAGGPAYSVTVPGVVLVAVMRLRRGTDDAIDEIGGG